MVKVREDDWSSLWPPLQSLCDTCFPFTTSATNQQNTDVPLMNTASWLKIVPGLPTIWNIFLLPNFSLYAWKISPFFKNHFKHQCLMELIMMMSTICLVLILWWSLCVIIWFNPNITTLRYYHSALQMTDARGSQELNCKPKRSKTAFQVGLHLVYSLLSLPKH